MDNLADSADAALVIVAFLQADSVYRDSIYSQEILSLRNDIPTSWNINLHRHIDDGIETDGHLSESVTLSLDDIQPVAELPRVGKLNFT